MEHENEFVGALTSQGVKRSVAEAIDELRSDAEREHRNPIAYNVIETPDEHITVRVKL